MTDFLRRNPLVSGLAVLCAVLAVIVAIELAALGQTPAPPAPPKAAPADARLLPAIAMGTPEAAYPETAARPLWIPTRRPAPPATGAARRLFRRQMVLSEVHQTLRGLIEALQEAERELGVRG